MSQLLTGLSGFVFGLLAALVVAVYWPDQRFGGPGGGPRG